MAVAPGCWVILALLGLLNTRSNRVDVAMADRNAGRQNKKKRSSKTKMDLYPEYRYISLIGIKKTPIPRNQP
eukprot:12918498-Prorocentrum_lima.AAC.1